jgi:hypothetical protein
MGAVHMANIHTNPYLRLGLLDGLRNAHGLYGERKEEKNEGEKKKKKKSTK